MRVDPREFKNGTTKCSHCGRPFRIVDGRVECWRSSTGAIFCNEFCADDVEGAAFPIEISSMNPDGPIAAGHNYGAWWRYQENEITLCDILGEFGGKFSIS
jgi:hypothetical protein